MAVASPESMMPKPLAASSSATAQSGAGKGFDVVDAYHRALNDDKNPHPIAAIVALVDQMQASTAETTTGLARDMQAALSRLKSSQKSLGVRAGCQLWANFFADSQYSSYEFDDYKRNLIEQGRAFCNVTAAQCREKIADLAVDFLKDDCTILTHSYSRTVMRTILKATAQHKRIKVYVTEAKPNALGLKTHEILTRENIPCTLVLDSAVAYVMERVDMVLVGSEAVMESGGLVSAVGTYQMALLAKSHQKPFYALAESYKFLRHFPLSQTDLPNPRSALLHGRSVLPLSFDTSTRTNGHLKADGEQVESPPPSTPLDDSTSLGTGTGADQGEAGNGKGKGTGTGKVTGAGRGVATGNASGKRGKERHVTQDMLDLNPEVDVTMPALIDYVITDLGSPLSPTSVSQYIVAQFAT